MNKPFFQIYFCSYQSHMIYNEKSMSKYEKY
uniref:Uncharacterized protein n=1 Tax=Cryptosporidium parvum TaxID=5807 RepID=F0X6A2_CRYPV